jgi:hypothetical protein
MRETDCGAGYRERDQTAVFLLLVERVGADAWTSKYAGADASTSEYRNIDA